MKILLASVFSLFAFFHIAGAQTDTLRVIILQPYKVAVMPAAEKDYQSIQQELRTQRSITQKQKRDARDADKAAYNDLPGYTKAMFDNEISFYDSLNADNYVSLLARNYTDYRLFRPYKIKPRLVLVSFRQAAANSKNYAALCDGYSNVFIINFPQVTISRNNGGLQVTVKTELYSGKTGTVILAEEHTGNVKATPTDMPMCTDGKWDCAFVNAVYPALPKCVMLIAGKKE